MPNWPQSCSSRSAPNKRSATGHVTGIKAWPIICKDAGIDGVRPHDLRRTLGSWMAAGGFSLPVIGKALSHRSQAATAVYARMNLDPVRGAVQTAADSMLEAGGESILSRRPK